MKLRLFIFEKLPSRISFQSVQIKGELKIRRPSAQMKIDLKVEKVSEATTKEYNKWNNFVLWCSLRKINAVTEIENLETQDTYDEEEYNLCQETLEVINSNIQRAKTTQQLIQLNINKLKEISQNLQE